MVEDILETIFFTTQRADEWLRADGGARDGKTTGAMETSGKAMADCLFLFSGGGNGNVTES